MASELKKTKDELSVEKQKRKEAEDQLSVAKEYIKSFRIDHPDWKPPADVLLMSEDVQEGIHVFNVSFVLSVNPHPNPRPNPNPHPNLNPPDALTQYTTYIYR